MLIVKFALPCPTSPLSWVIVAHRVNPTPLHGVMLSKIWQIGDLTNLTNLIFHAEAVVLVIFFLNLFFMCLSYCLIQSSELHNGFSLHLVSSEPCTGMHTQPLSHCSLCTEQFRKSRRYTFLHTRAFQEPATPVLHHVPQPIGEFWAGCAKLPWDYQQTELYFSPSLELPNITDYSLRWKSHIHCRDQSFSHRKPRGCGPLQNAAFWLKAKSLAYGK